MQELALLQVQIPKKKKPGKNDSKGAAVLSPFESEFDSCREYLKRRYDKLEERYYKDINYHHSS